MAQVARMAAATGLQPGMDLKHSSGPRQSSAQAMASLSFSSTFRGARLSSSATPSTARGPARLEVSNKVASKSVEKIDWSEKRRTLLSRGVRSITAKEALRLQKEEGFMILDVRPKYEYEALHPEGAKNAEIYRLIKEWTAWDILRRAGFAFFGVFNGTEENPSFREDVAALGVSKDSKIVTACAFGGTTRPSQNFTEGKESRSLIAAYVLITEGYKAVYHLEGGLSTWFREEYPVAGKEVDE